MVQKIFPDHGRSAAVEVDRSDVRRIFRYAGKSIFKWEEIKLGKNGKGGSISKSLHDRLITYARANASLGINGSILNNVNASPKMMTAEYINKVKVIANILRPFAPPCAYKTNPSAKGHTTFSRQP